MSESWPITPPSRAAPSRVPKEIQPSIPQSSRITVEDPPRHVDHRVDDAGLAATGERALDQAPLVDEDRDPVGVDEAGPALAAAEHHRAREELVVAGDDPDVGRALEEPA